MVGTISRNRSARLISRITRLRHAGVLRDFTWPAELPTFGRYNLIYGWNGSGKTTISKLLRALELRSAPASGEVTLSINGTDVTGQEFHQATLPVRVFNRDFVTESVFPLGGGDVPPILVLGKESVEKQKEVEQVKQNLADAHAALELARSQTQTAEKALDKHCIDRANVIRDTLRASGASPYNSYDKAGYRLRARTMVERGDREAHLLSDSEREKLLAQHRATLKPVIQEISYQPPILAEQLNTVSRLLKATVVSAVNQSLDDDQDLSTWVHQGLALHQVRHVDSCLFCKQPMPSGHLAALSAHFSTEYEEFLASLDAQVAQIEAVSKASSTLWLPSRAEFYDDLAADYEPARTTFKESLDSTVAVLDLLVQALANKKTRIFQSIDFTVSAPEVDRGLVDRLNEIIHQHNEACHDLRNRASEARRRLEADSVARALEGFQELVAAVQESESSLKQADADKALFNDQIGRLESEILEHRRPADELNDDLFKYLGHEELRLAVKDTGYMITREGTPAQALSEGETNAVALLYFLKALQDKRFDLRDGVVVLDDPVSSLDANALYLAFGFIRERTKDAAQLFVFTHNFTFFRQVRNWFHNLKGQKKTDTDQRPARFYMLDCVRDGDQRCSSILPLDPLLEQYESEYHYLFSRIYRAAAVSIPPALEANYILPNMARRLLEAFLAFRQPHIPGQLWQKLNYIEFDEAKKLRILRFLHTHSHGDAIGEPEHDPSLLGEAAAVLRDLLELIKDQDPRHFSAMVSLVDPAAEGQDDA